MVRANLETWLYISVNVHAYVLNADSVHNYVSLWQQRNPLRK